jgi:hypothetical protein
MSVERPAKCWGPRAEQHCAGCRIGRPRCRWRRKAVGLCHCEAYHYPHRKGSGPCGNDEAMALICWGPLKTG